MCLLRQTNKSIKICNLYEHSKNNFGLIFKTKICNYNFLLTKNFLKCIFRFKQESRREHEWVSLPVPTSKNNLLVTGLLGGTSYQFCILPQNKLGSGPFSEILTVRTKGLYL